MSIIKNNTVSINNMYSIIIQLAVENTFVPKKTLIRKWSREALQQKVKAAEITIRIVSIEEMTLLNSTYRHKTGPTNVLSFPADIPKNINFTTPILGDIVICAEVVNKEAKEQHKTNEAHWAHMIIHGIFHLLGYDHVEAKEAEIMESMEIEILQNLGFENPYATGEDETR